MIGFEGIFRHSRVPLGTPTPAASIRSQDGLRGSGAGVGALEAARIDFAAPKLCFGSLGTRDANRVLMGTPGKGERKLGSLIAFRFCSL